MILNSPYITGSIIVTGNANVQGTLTVTGSLSGTATSASLALNSNLLQGTGSVGFATTGAFSATSGSASSRLTQIEQVYATTGSNSFRATQSITGSLTVTGQIIAQTINVQQVTSSIVFSSGSNIFGSDLNSRQTFTGSVNITGSLTVNTTGTELQVTNNGVVIGNLLSDNHSITGSLRITGSNVTMVGALTGTSATFAGNVIIRPSSGYNALFQVSSTTFRTNYLNDAQDTNISAAYRAADFVWQNNLGQPSMTLTSGGNVGIGTTDTQTFRLAVDGPNVGQGDTTTTMRIFDTTSATTGTGGGISFAGYFSGTSSIVNTFSYIKGGKENSTSGDFASYLSFGTRANGGAPTERMRITSGGELRLVGAAGTLRIGTNASDYGLLIYSGGVVYLQNAWASTNGYVSIVANGVGLNVFGTGNATLTGTLTQSASDERLKNNIQIIPNALNKISQLRGVTFEWNQEIYGTSRTTDIGIIAQDVQSILPDAVALAPFDTNFKTNTSKSGENYLTVYYEKLIPLLIEGMKELKAEVDDLKSQLNK